MVWVGCATAGALAFQNVSKHTYKVIYFKPLLSRNSRNVIHEFSERVVTEMDTHAVRLSDSSRHCQQATSDGVCLFQTPDLF